MSAALSRDLARVRALVELAADPRTPEDEARNSALQACRRIKSGGLVLGVLDERGGLSTEATARAARVEERLVCVACALIVMAETSKSYRVAYATERSRTHGSAQAGWVPKRLAVRIEFLDAVDARKRYGTVRPVMSAIHVATRDVEALKRCVRTTERYEG